MTSSSSTARPPVADAVLLFPDLTEGYRETEALCLVCNLTFHRLLGACPTCKELHS